MKWSAYIKWYILNNQYILVASQLWTMICYLQALLWGGAVSLESIWLDRNLSSATWVINIYIFFLLKKYYNFCINFLKALLADNLKANIHGLKAKHNYFTLTKYFIVFTRLMQRQLCLFTGWLLQKMCCWKSLCSTSPTLATNGVSLGWDYRFVWPMARGSVWETFIAFAIAFGDVSGSEITRLTF